MRYMGSKRAYAEELIQVMQVNERGRNVHFVEPFCGSCSVIKLVEGKRIANDLHSDLIALYAALQNGWQPPASISEEKYRYIKNNPVEPELKAYAGFYFSFGAKYLDTYRRNKANRKGNPINTQKISSQALEDIAELRQLIEGIKFFNLPYPLLKIPAGSIVYCDPPYHGTTGYGLGEFDHNVFWNWVRSCSVYNTVYVSEYSAPKDFKCVWQKKTRVMLDNRSNHFGVTEKLFTLK